MQESGHVSIVGYYSRVNRYLRALGSFNVIFPEAVLYDRGEQILVAQNV